MVPRTTNGSSFHRAAGYFLRDKGVDSAERVAWSETLNLRTDDPSAAIAQMAFTARHAEELKAAAGIATAGQKLEKPVWQFSLSWHIGECPDRSEMMEAVHSALASRGAQDRQALVVCHRDEPQPHVHVIVNRVHPETGRALDQHRDHLDLSKWAEKWEREHGKIYCEERVKNNERRREGEFVKHADKAIARAWEQSDNGRSFAAALAAQGYTLARGERRDFVVVDPQGKAINPRREIEGVKAKDIHAKLADLDPASLPSAAQVQKQREAERRRAPNIWDREAAEIERQKRELEAADAAAEREKTERGAVGKGDTGRLKPEAEEEKRLRIRPKAFDEQRAAVRLSPERFEEWAKRKQAALRMFNLNERLEFITAQRREMEQKREEAERDYGAAIRRAEATLAEIEARREQRGVRRLVYRVTGKAKEDERTAATEQATLENLRWRSAERTEPLKERHAEEIRQLEQRQQEREGKLEHRIEVLRWRSENYRRTHPEPEKAPELEPANDRKAPDEREESPAEELARLRAEYRERHGDRTFDRDR